MTLREQVLQDALALAPEDRVFVLDRLEQSLDSHGFASPEIAAAWMREIERRVSAFERGEIQAEGTDVVLPRMRRFLDEYRSRKCVPRPAKMNGRRLCFGFARRAIEQISNLDLRCPLFHVVEVQSVAL